LPVVILLALVATISFGVAGTSAAGAATPECTGGDIKGAGTVLQRVAQWEVWAPGFSSEACPEGPTVQFFEAEGSAALENWLYHDGNPAAFNVELQFLATDEPPTPPQLANIEKASKGADVVVIPVAQAAIAIPANPPAGCVVDDITNMDLERVFRGVLTQWSQLATAAGSCGSPITRVVRQDGGGITDQLKSYFFRINPTPLLCTAGNGLTGGEATWQELAPVENPASGAPNTTWAESCGHTQLSTLVKPINPGNERVVETVAATAGSIGYAALNEAKQVSGGFTILDVQNNGWKPAGEATFADPASGGQANCAAAKYAVPVEGQQGSGGGVDVDWSHVSGSKPGIGGTDYPLCMLTYDLALRGYGLAGYSYKRFKTTRDFLRDYVVLGGQTALVGSGLYYAPLPTATGPQYNVLAAARLAAGKMAY
jgi:ABC-type phosphate transport system substrate-binding protein